MGFNASAAHPSRNNQPSPNTSAHKRNTVQKNHAPARSVGNRIANSDSPKSVVEIRNRMVARKWLLAVKDWKIADAGPER